MRDLKQGEVLAREGAVDNHLYVILAGTLGVVKNAGSNDAITINTLAAGDFVGEMGFMDGSEAYASKIALGDTRVLGLEREKLESLLTTRSADRLPRDARDHPRRPPDPAPAVDAAGRAVELHLQAARPVLIAVRGR